MRILFLNGHPVWKNGLPWGFRQLGHDVEIVDVIQRDDLIHRMETFQPDMLLTVGWIDQYNSSENLQIIKYVAHSFGCLHAYWDTESANFLERWSLPMVRAIQPDAVFTINADCIKYYHDIGVPAFHLQFGYSPAFYPDDTETDTRYMHDVSMVANAYDVWKSLLAFRQESVEILVRPLVDRGYDLALWGDGWEAEPSILRPGAVARYFQGFMPTDPGRVRLNLRNGGRPVMVNVSPLPPASVHLGGAIPFRDAFHVFRNSKITLNPQNINTSDSQVTSRTFEILGCGGFQLTARTPAVEKLFIHGRHLVMSGSPAETRELVAYYLAHDEERLAIAANGRAEVFAKHTFDKRAAYMLSCLGKN